MIVLHYALFTYARLIVPSTYSTQPIHILLKRHCQVHITQNGKIFLFNSVIFFHQLLLKTTDEQNAV